MCAHRNVYAYIVNGEITCTLCILNILTHFLEFNTCMMPDFLCYKVQKKNIRLNFEDGLNLLNMSRKTRKI